MSEKGGFNGSQRRYLYQNKIGPLFGHAVTLVEFPCVPAIPGRKELNSPQPCPSSLPPFYLLASHAGYRTFPSHTQK